MREFILVAVKSRNERYDVYLDGVLVAKFSVEPGWFDARLVPCGTQFFADDHFDWKMNEVDRERILRSACAELVAALMEKSGKKMYKIQKNMMDAIEAIDPDSGCLSELIYGGGRHDHRDQGLDPNQVSRKTLFWVHRPR